MNDFSTPPMQVVPEPGDTYVQSFARGLAVIRSFDAQSPSQTLSDVAARSGLTRAGARRILLTLAHLGYVKASERRFSLTPRILDLGFAYLSSQPLWQVAEPEIEALVAEVKESSSAAVLDGGDVIYVARVAPRTIMSISLGVGSRLPAHCTALGRVLLGGMKEAELATWLERHPPTSVTPRTVTDVSTLIDIVAGARADGWCLVDQELEEGLVSIAAPIVDRGGRIVAALNLSGQVNRTPPEYLREALVPRLVETTRRISDLLIKRA